MLTSTLHAIVLGIIQGLAEFIPISSSGHLVLVPAIFGIQPGGLSFDVALHMGTMLAVIVYMRRELFTMLAALTGRDRSHDALVYRKLGWFTIAASVPIGFVGVGFVDVFEEIFATPMIAAVMLLVTGALLLLGEHIRDRRVAHSPQPVGVPADGADEARLAPTEAAFTDEARGARLPLADDRHDPRGLDLDGMTLREALLVGLAQCAALMPGLSRSGTTIVAGMASGLTREAATRFSFLLSLPALAGASLVSLPELDEVTQVYPLPAIVAGVVAAFAAGYVAIRLLLSLVARDRLTGFALYCFGAGLLALVVLWL